MSLRRQDASDEEEDSKSEEEFFSDSEGSIAGREGVTESPVADPELAAATERLRLSQQAEHADRVEDSEQIDTAPAGSAEPDDESEEVDPSEESDGSFVEQQAAQNEGDHNDVDSVSQEELLAGSEVDITAAEEVLEEDPDPNKPVDKSEKAPYEVPVGAFWLHDDRLDEDAGQRRTSRPKKLWDKLDDMEWVHDKFDLPPEEDDYQGFLASRGRGRGRGGGPSYGSDGSSYPANTYHDDFENGGGYEGRGRGGRRGRGRRGGFQSGYPDNGSSGYHSGYAGVETSYQVEASGYGFGGRGGRGGRGRRGGFQSGEDNGSYWGGEGSYGRSRGNGTYNDGQNGGQESGYGEFENPPPGYDAAPPGYAKRSGAGRNATAVDKWPTEDAVTGAGNWGTAAAEADSADSQWPSLPSQPAAQPQQGSWGAAEPQQGNWAAVEPQQGSWGAAEPQQNSWAAAEPQQNSWAAAKPAVTKPQPAAAKPGDWGAIAEQTLGLAHLPAAEPGWGGVGAPQQQGHPEEQSGWGGNDHAGNAHRAQKPSRTNSQSWGAPERSDGAPERSGGAPERSGGAPERSGGAPERSGANGTATVVRAGDWAAAASDQPRANGWGAPNQPAQQPSVAESGGWGEASSLPTRAATSQQSWSEGERASQVQTKPQQQVAVQPGDWGAVAVNTGLWLPSEGGQQEPDVTERWGADTKAAESSSAPKAEYRNDNNSAPRAEYRIDKEQAPSYGGAAAARPNEWQQQQPQQPAWTGDTYGQPAEAAAEAGWQAPSADAAHRKAFLEKVAAAAAVVRTSGGRSQPQQADGYAGHDAQSWQGHRQERSGSLNAAAQDFVPPGGGLATQRLLPRPRHSNPEAFYPGQPGTNPAAFAEYALRPPLPSTPQEMRYGFDSVQAYLPYQGAQDVPIEGYAAGAAQMDGGFVPGPMQQSQLYQGAMQAQRPAKRPITIEAPPERERENARAGDQAGGRRYSAMSSQQHYQQ